MPFGKRRKNWKKNHDQNPSHMNRFGQLILLLIFFQAIPGFGQNQAMNEIDSTRNPSPKFYPDKAYFKSYLTDSKDLVCSPFRWNQFQWIGATVVVGSTVFLFTQDAKIQEWVQDHKSKTLDDVSKYVFEPVGSGVYTLTALGIMYGCGWIINNQKAKVTAMKGVESFILASITTQIIKHLTHRHRPNQDNPPNPTLWEGPFQGFDFTSFPSGHATAAFAVATVLGTAYKETIWVPILCYSLATGAALSRIYDNQHWASDVLVGSVIGFAVGKLVINTKKIQVLPVSPTGPGITLSYRLD
jgi:hypothetical protein